MRMLNTDPNGSALNKLVVMLQHASKKVLEAHWTQLDAYLILILSIPLRSVISFSRLELNGAFKASTKQLDAC